MQSTNSVKIQHVDGLGLALDPRLHEIRREGQTVRLHGNRILWRLLVALGDVHPYYFAKEDLIQRVWEGTSITDSTFSRAVHDLRVALKPLGVGIEFTRNMGYLLIAA